MFYFEICTVFLNILNRLRHMVSLFPGGSVVKKKSTCDAGNTSSIPEWQEIPCRRKWQPTPVFLPGKSHDQAWWGTKVHWVMKELDTT